MYYSIMNKVKRFRNYKDGFTIIEVVLVLAIAGLIFLMVFIALPALQRSQRDTQRKRDTDRLLAAIQSYQSNNLGRLPDEIDHSAPINSYSDINDTNFGRNYLRQDGYFSNPEGTVYVIYTSTRVNPGETLPDNSVNDFWLARGVECDGEDLKLTVANNWASLRNGSNRVAVRIKLEGGGIYCVNN